MTMETKVHDKTIAEVAIEILDERGEFAALPFLMGHVDINQEPVAWTDDGRLTLQDGSTVEHAENGFYRFCWRDADGNDCEQLKASAMPSWGRPDAPTAPRVLMNWPTIIDVLERIDELVESRAGIDPDQPVISFPEMCRVAPSLYWAIRKANDDAAFPDGVHKYLDASVVTIAENALDHLPEDEMERLRAAYVAAFNAD